MNPNGMKFGAQIALLVGLVLVLTARGCDELGARNVERLSANAKLIPERATRYYTNKIEDLEAERAKTDTSADRKKEIDKEIEQAKKDQKSEIDSNKSDWRDLQDDAADEVEANRAWGYWRSMLFLFGTIVFTLGLVGMIFVSTGPERYLCFGMLLIIVMFVYGSSIGINIGRR